MRFSEALTLMRNGEAVRRPHWLGYWKIEPCEDCKTTVMMYCKDGSKIDIRKAEYVQFTLDNINQDDWICCNPNIVTVTPTFTFGEAIVKLKQGEKLARVGWNGKNMFIWLKRGASIKSEWCKDHVLKSLADANGGEIEGLGTICMYTADKKILTGWLASQSDILSEDWVVVD